MADPKVQLNPVTVNFVDTAPTVSQSVPVTAANPLPVTMAGSGGSTVGLVPITSGGMSRSYAQLANTTNATVVKASAGQVYRIEAFNNSAVIAYLKFYDKATAPTVGSDTVVWKVLIPASTSGTGVALDEVMGLVFSTGIGYAVTTGIADSDTGAVAASAYIVDIGYK